MKIDRLALEVKIGGKRARPSLLRVDQYSGVPPHCEMVLSGEYRQAVDVGDRVLVSLDSKRIFTGALLVSSTVHGGIMHKCGHNLQATVLNFRKEKAPYIFDALADKAGVDEWKGDVPFVEFAHFHCDGGGWGNLLAFAEGLSDFSDDSFDLYFDSAGVLRLHATEDSGSISVEFNRGENALLITDKAVTAFPRPLGYGDYIKVNSKVRRINGLRYLISPRNSVMEAMF